METEVKVEELLEILRGNRDSHLETFNQAMDGYRLEWMEILERRLSDIQTGKPIQMWVHIAEPKNQTKDYERVIRMLELEVNETWVLDESDFAQYVEDDWIWSREFRETSTYLNSKYSG